MRRMGLYGFAAVPVLSLMDRVARAVNMYRHIAM